MPTEPENDIGLTTIHALVAVMVAIAACVLLAFGAVWVSGVVLEWISK